MLWPKLPRGPSISIAGRLNRKDPGASGPGPIYDVHVSFPKYTEYLTSSRLDLTLTYPLHCKFLQKKVNFKTGPSFSFGRGRGDRFSAINYLPEIDD
jgi:hypothetical protein